MEKVAIVHDCLDFVDERVPNLFLTTVNCLLNSRRTPHNFTPFCAYVLLKPAVSGHNHPQPKAWENECSTQYLSHF